VVAETMRLGDLSEAETARLWTALWFLWDMKRPLKWRQKHNKLSMVYGLPMFAWRKLSCHTSFYCDRISRMG
jgi:hypothetical protein